MFLHGQFERDAKNLKTPDSRIRNWLTHGESSIVEARDRALNTNSICQETYLSRVKRTRWKALCIMHIVSACSRLTEKDYKKLHDKVWTNLHWNFWQKYSFKVRRKWFQQEAQKEQGNDQVKFFWDRHIQHCTCRLGILVVNKPKNECFIVDVAIP